MSYTITSAKWANEEHTAAILNTVEDGPVVVSQADTPTLWDDFIDWIEGGGVPAAFVPVERRRRRQLISVADDIRDWVNAGSTQAIRLERLTKVASIGLAVQLVADPTLGPTLGIPVAGDEPEV